MLRLATSEDFDVVKEMVMKFVAVSGYADLTDEDTLNGLIKYMLSGEDPNTVVVLADGGMIAGRLDKFPFGDLLVTSEVAWWVDPEQRKLGLGKELVDAYEYWAKLKGAKICVMSALDDDLGKFYEKKGYELYERAYMKVI